MSDDVAGGPSVTSAVHDAFARGQRAWPGVELSIEQYASFVSERHATAESANLELHPDLYLACACSLGVQAAREAIERSIMSDVPKAIRRVSSDPEFIADVAADLRLSLLTGTDGKPSALERYQGRGPLRSFVMVLAMRRAIDRKRRQREVVSAPSAFEYIARDDDSSIARVDSGGLRAAFLVALRQKLSALPPRDRNILRLHIIDGVSADVIGRMYNVHRATATRWIAQAKQVVFDETSASLQGQFNVSPATFASFARDAAQGLDAELSTFLRAAPPGDDG